MHGTASYASKMRVKADARFVRERDLTLCALMTAPLEIPRYMHTCYMQDMNTRAAHLCSVLSTWHTVTRIIKALITNQSKKC